MLMQIIIHIMYIKCQEYCWAIFQYFGNIVSDILLDIMDILGYRNIIFQYLSYLSSLHMLNIKYIVLDMNSRVRNPIAMRLKYQTVTFSQQNCEIFTCGSLPISYVNKFGTFGAKTIFIHELRQYIKFNIAQH